MTGTRHGTTTTVFTLTVNADGTYTFNQFAPLQHPNAGTDTDSFNFGFTIKDGDGDVSGAATITVKVTDDIVTLGSADAGKVDEEGLTGGNAGDTYNSSIIAPQGGTTVSGSLGIDFGAVGLPLRPRLPPIPARRRR